MIHRDLALFADYYQFYLQDEDAEGNLSEAWSDDAVDRLLAVAPGTIGVGTVRNTAVPVTIGVVDCKPMMEADSFDHIVECSVTFGSGKIVVAGWADDLEEAARFHLAPGTYRVRVNYAGLNTVWPDGLEGNDRYYIQLWPAVEGPVTILKNRAINPVAQRFDVRYGS
ncbi:hypothetical protein [Massilia niabensis]|uniref:Uncharacterized protein n=1 Tax=Massilia niabensis TaxID=544910 RepID=A0ABW0L6E8_9BURK